MPEARLGACCGATGTVARVTVRVGIIGAGNIGTAHAVNLSGSVAGATVSVVFDADMTRAEAVAGQVGGRAAPDVAAVFQDDEVDAVLIASPDALHAEQLRIGFVAGKPILCEKPLAVTEADAREMVDIEAGLGRRLVQLGFMRRFDPGYMAMKAELTDDGIGRPLIVHNIHRNTRAPYGLATPQTLTNMVIHEFDINRWLLDDEYATVDVLAPSPGPLTPEGELDPILVVLSTAGGVLVEIEAFVNSQYGYEVVCRVTGSLGQSVMGDGSFVTRSRAFHRGTALPELWLGRFAEAYRIQLQAWIDAIRTASPFPGASVWDGYAATVVANRAIDAYRSGTRVAVELPARPALYDNNAPA